MSHRRTAGGRRVSTSGLPGTFSVCGTWDTRSGRPSMPPVIGPFPIPVPLPHTVSVQHSVNGPHSAQHGRGRTGRGRDAHPARIDRHLDHGQGTGREAAAPVNPHRCPASDGDIDPDVGRAGVVRAVRSGPLHRGPHGRTTGGQCLSTGRGLLKDDRLNRPLSGSLLIQTVSGRHPRDAAGQEATRCSAQPCDEDQPFFDDVDAPPQRTAAPPPHRGRSCHHQHSPPMSESADSPSSVSSRALPSGLPVSKGQRPHLPERKVPPRQGRDLEPVGVSA